jgi:hypothetical protein
MYWQLHAIPHEVRKGALACAGIYAYVIFKGGALLRPASYGGHAVNKARIK